MLKNEHIGGFYYFPVPALSKDARFPFCNTKSFS